MPTIANLNDEISQLETRVLRLKQQRTQLQADVDAANAQRPIGIPPEWKPKFDGSGVNLRVYAWLDPNKLGE